MTESMRTLLSAFRAIGEEAGGSAAATPRPLWLPAVVPRIESTGPSPSRPSAP
jgi:hypothetical protein